MIYITNNTWEYKKQRLSCWHRWFAWFPVSVYKYPDGARKRAWLQWVERKGEYSCGWGEVGWDFKYRLIGGKGE